VHPLTLQQPAAAATARPEVSGPTPSWAVL
jgi:hypothetical protein